MIKKNMRAFFTLISAIMLINATIALADMQETIASLKNQAKQAQLQAADSTQVADTKLKEAAVIETQIAGQLKIIATQEKEVADLKGKAADLGKQVADALKKANLKTKEASEIHEKLAQIRKNSAIKLTGTEKNLEENEADQEQQEAKTLLKQAQSISDEADKQLTEANSDQQIAAAIASQASEMKKQSDKAQSDLERMEKDRQALAALNKIPKEQQAAKDQSVEIARKLNLLINNARNKLDQITIAQIKSNEKSAKESWSSFISILNDAEKENQLYKDLHGSTQSELIIEQASSNHKQTQDMVAKLFDSIEQQITTSTGDPKHALIALYETWTDQWLQHPFGAAKNDRHNLADKVKAFIQKLHEKEQPSTPAAQAPAQPHLDHNGDEIIAPPAY